MNFYFMKTANVPVYGNIEVYGNIALSVPSASVYREEINKCILAITKILQTLITEIVNVQIPQKFDYNKSLSL